MADLLSGYRFVDLTGERVLLAGRMLADLGAEFVQVEPPGGSPARSVGPFAGVGAGATSLCWEAFASDKRSVVLDAGDPAEQDALVALQGPTWATGVAILCRCSTRAANRSSTERPPGA